MWNWKLNIREIVEIAMLVNFAVILDLRTFKIPIFATGGSISLTMVPLLILALRHGFLKSFISIGIVYGLVTNMIDGYGFHTYPFDYLLAYGSLAILSFFAKWIMIDKKKVTWLTVVILIAGVSLAVFARLIGHVISGMVIYQVNFWGSVTYNATYLLPSYGITVVALLLLYRPLLEIQRIYPPQISR
jgi:thiamine transporter